jgi:hypothetical protein
LNAAETEGRAHQSRASTAAATVTQRDLLSQRFMFVELKHPDRKCQTQKGLNVLETGIFGT